MLDEDADKGQDVGERPVRRDRDELVDQRRDQARLLGDAGADHGGDHQAHGGKGHEVGNERRVHEANAVGIQQAADRRARFLDLMRVRVDALESDRRSKRAQHRRQRDDDGNQDEKDDHRVGNHVAHFLDAVEKLLHRCFWCGGGTGHRFDPQSKGCAQRAA